MSTAPAPPPVNSSSEGAALMLAERSERVDGIVVAAAACRTGLPAYPRAEGAGVQELAGRRPPSLQETGATVLAVGGYGRRQLFP